MVTQEPIQKALSMIQDAYNLIDQSLKVLPEDIECFNRKEHIKNAGTALTFMASMMNNIYDLKPDLVPKKLQPSLAPIDLEKHIEHIKSNDSRIQNSAIHSIKIYLPKDILEIFLEKKDPIEKFKIAKNWWDLQPKPYIPIYKVARLLTDKKLFMRFHSAKAIEKKYGVTLWDEKKGDINKGSVDSWFEVENINI